MIERVSGPSAGGLDHLDREGGDPGIEGRRAYSGASTLWGYHARAAHGRILS
ncbi:MAG: hypothetical protein M0C28_40195 [Candidatus Moduliflexus flocculans]|nr:hypothetical protein [Candidatus Moduliflexus flocculans]